jgi:hypothetical protein
MLLECCRYKISLYICQTKTIQTMTTQQLSTRIDLRLTSYGHYRVTIQYRGKQYSCTTTNTMAVDRINSDEPDKSALLSLWNECKSANNL